MSLEIPIRKVDIDSENENEFRNGTYKITFINTIPEDLTPDLTIDIRGEEYGLPFISDTRIKILDYNYNSKTHIFTLYIRIRENPLFTTTAIIILGGVLGVLGLTYLVYSGAEQIILIPVVAIILVVGIGFLSDTGITKQIKKFISGL